MGYTATGIGSWYGKQFHGKTMSNGKEFNMYNISVVSKTLPLGTVIRATNIENHRYITATITDRGPFHNKRILDLSYAAAKKLRYLNKRTTMVSIQVIKV